MPAVSLRYLVEPVDEQGVALDLNIVLQSSLVPQKVLHQGNTLGWKDQSKKNIKRFVPVISNYVEQTD